MIIDSGFLNFWNKIKFELKKKKKEKNWSKSSEENLRNDCWAKCVLRSKGKSMSTNFLYLTLI